MSYRYIGNKARLTTLLTSLVRERIPPHGQVADLMCGTGSFSAAMRHAGFRVYAADIMTFAYLHARVRLMMGAEPPFEGMGATYHEALSELNALPLQKGFIYREYGADGRPDAGCRPRMYFSPDNAARLDAIVGAVREWYASGQLSRDEHDLLRHDMVLAANRVANIAGTYGHYWSKWSNAALEALELRPSLFSGEDSTNHEVHQGPAESLAQGLRADLCYLDPPYTKRQYAANYHIPETLARGDEPPAIGVSGLRSWRDQYSDFCSKVRVRDSFAAVISGMDCPRFLISYSEDGLLSRTQMMDFLKRFGSVQCIEVKIQRFRSNESLLGRYVSEYVFDLQRA